MVLMLLVAASNLSDSLAMVISRRSRASETGAKMSWTH